MTPREQLLEPIRELDEKRVEAMLLLLTDRPQTSQSEIDEGERSDESSADPFGGLIGMIGDEYDGPTDVSANIHKYVADAIEAG